MYPRTSPGLIQPGTAAPELLEVAVDGVVVSDGAVVVEPEEGDPVVVDEDPEDPERVDVEDPVRPATGLEALQPESTMASTQPATSIEDWPTRSLRLVRCACLGVDLGMLFRRTICRQVAQS